MDAADGKAANWTLCRLLRDGGISRISGHSLRHCDRSALGSAGASRRRIKTWAASLLVESNSVLARQSAGNLLYLSSPATDTECPGSGPHREGDAARTSSD